MDAEELRHAKAQMIAVMRRGLGWQEAAESVGVQTSRATAYRLLQRVRTNGEGALHDRRHGHPSKLRGPVRQWLEAYCRGAPAASGRIVQAALQERFGLSVTIRHINQVRATLGLSRRRQDVGGKSGH